MDLEKMGRYAIVKELGRGAMGRVYLGLHETLQRRVAIKVVANSQMLNEACPLA